MFKEKNLIFRAEKEVTGDSAAEGQGGHINFYGNAEDPDKALRQKENNPDYKKGLVTKDDINIHTVDGKDVLRFGGDRNAIKGEDVFDLLSVASASGGDFIDVSFDNNKAALAVWDRDHYEFMDGPSRGKPVRFLNGKKYTVSSAMERISSLPDPDFSPEGKVTLGEAAIVPPTPKVQSRFAQLDAQRGSSVDQTVNDALAQYSKPTEVRPTEQMLAMREKMAAKAADDANMRAGLESRYLREGEEPGKVAISFLKRRADNAAQEAKMEQAKQEFPAKLPEVKMLGRVDGGHKLQLPNGGLALYLEVPNKTVVPSADRKNVAIYDKNDQLEEVKDFSQLKPHTQSKINALYS